MSPKRRNRNLLRIEELESRLAPALLVGTSRVDYIDGDGDRIAIMASAPIFTDVDTANLILTFTNASLVESDNDITNDLPDTLQTIDLTQANSELTPGLNLTVKLVSKGSGANGSVGDGTVPGIIIEATDIALGTVTVKGDISQINAGDGSTAIKTLTVDTIGVLSTSVAVSALSGNVGTLKVGGDVTEASLVVDGNVSALQIGGSLIGTGDDESGHIAATGDLTSVRITKNVTGGAGLNSASITSSAGKIWSLWVGGSISGGDGDNSALISSNGAIGSVGIVGSLIGGTAAGTSYSGTILSVTDDILAVNIGGHLLGGAADNSGQLFSFFNIGPVKIGGNIQGGDGLNSGRIHADGNVGDVTVFGSLKGSTLGTSTNNGEISSYGDMGNIRINGDIVGGAAQGSGDIIVGGNLKTLLVGKSLQAGDDLFTGGVFVFGNITTVRVGLHLDGTKGIGGYAASIIAGLTIDTTAGLPTGINPVSQSWIGSVTIGGSVRGGGDAIAQVSGISGAIIATGNISSIKITGNLEGGVPATSSDPTGYIQGRRLPVINIGGSIKTPTSLASSGTTLENSGAIRAVYDIGILNVKGSLIGNSTTRVGISAFGEEVPDSTDKTLGDGNITSDTAITSIAIFGNVAYTQILAGFQVDETLASFTVAPQNSEASIGTFNGTKPKTGVTVNGTWTASDIVAGGDPGADTFFGSLDWVGNADTSTVGAGSGTTDDAAISGGSRNFGDFTTVTQNASIAYITIKGTLGGSAAITTDSYAFVAADWSQSKVTVKVANTTRTRNGTSTDPTLWSKAVTASSGTPQNLGPTTNDVFIISL